MSRILIVDDKDENLYFLEVLLQAHGYEVISAKHGAEALVKAWQSRPDIVISDLLMPVMDGYTLLRKWKVDAVLRNIPFIVYTATYTEPEDEHLALSLGADAFILKPAEPEEFIQKLREVEQKISAHDAPKAGASDDNEKFLLKVYSETLIRKLEEKTQQLEAANKALQMDLEKRKEAEAKIEHLAFYDPLTGLPNRRLMQDRLLHSHAVGSRNHRYGALLFIDLDHFKLLNDTKGHHVGDLLLTMVATRLQSCMREGDTVARIGGDEFVVILENLSEDLDQAAAMAETVGDKILSLVHQPYLLNTDDYLGSASIGVCMYRDQELSVEEILRRADTAMYQAKNNGRNTLRFYDPAMQAALESRVKLETDLQLAIKNNEFKLYFQPQVSETGEVFGAEALIRWQSPQHGLTLPNDFIPLAEETGLIVPMGTWVIKSACEQLRIWQHDAKKAHLQLSVNVSARQFYQADFVEVVLKMLIDNNVQAHRLKLELTESVVLDDVPAAISKMNALKEAGLRFSLDDFGTGYSSLSYLTQLPFAQLKVDQSFVRNLDNRQPNAIIVQTIIGMANNLSLEVIAEGVESETQFTFLKSLGCQQYQGYLFGKPMPIDLFESLLNP